MAITNADLGKLKKWQDKVSKELDMVDKTLDEVGKVSQECAAGGDDTAYGWFKKLGDEISEAYFGLAKAYRETMNVTGELIDRLKKGVNNVGEFIQQVADGFHL